MTKKTKVELLLYYEKELNRLDYLIDVNDQMNSTSLLEQYQKLAALLAQLRDTPTID